MKLKTVKLIILLLFSLSVPGCGIYKSKYVSENNIQRMNSWVIEKVNNQQLIINNMSNNNSKKNIVKSNILSKSNANKSSDLHKGIVSINTGQFHALLIGNDKYKYLDKLMSARNDVRIIGGILKSEYNFKVNIIYDADRDSIIQSLSNYRKTLDLNDNLLIYYAGHGWLDKEANEGYWLPVDSSLDNSANWISNADITTLIRALSAKHVLVIADSCYSGKLTRSILKEHDTLPAISKLLTKKARIVISSGGLEPVLDGGGDGNHSIFASAIINELNNNKYYIDGVSFFSKIRKRIGWNADQVPEYSVIHKAGHDGGDFVFINNRR